MSEVGEQVVITEYRDILPVGTVVRGFGDVLYTRVDANCNGWVVEGGTKRQRAPLPLVIVSRPN